MYVEKVINVRVFLSIPFVAHSKVIHIADMLRSCLSYALLFPFPANVDFISRPIGAIRSATISVFPLLTKKFLVRC